MKAKSCPIPAPYERSYPVISGKSWWRLEIHGRDGWYVPAVESAFPNNAEVPNIRHGLAIMLEGYGYAPDEELGETFHLRRL